MSIIATAISYSERLGISAIALWILKSVFGGMVQHAVSNFIANRLSEQGRKYLHKHIFRHRRRR